MHAQFLLTMILGMVLNISSLRAELTPGLPFSRGYEVLLVDSRYPDKPFVVQVAPTNIRGIRTLEAYIRANKGKGLPFIGNAIGPVVPTKPTKQHAWGFKFDAQKVAFYDASIELCDGSFPYVESHLAEYMYHIKSYCPWSTSHWLRSIRRIDYFYKVQNY